MTTEVEYLHRMLRIIREQHDALAKPYYDRLAQIEAMRAPRALRVTVDQAVAVGALPPGTTIVESEPARAGARPIVLPELPDHPTGFGWDPDESEAIRQAQRAAVEAERKGIVVTDEDVAAADLAKAGRHPAEWTCAILESFAARLRKSP